MTTLDELMQGGGKSAKFANIGDVVSGVILVEPKVRQVTDIKTGKPSFWDDNSPKQQIVVTLATDQRDPADPADDGHRTVYIKAWGDQMAGFRAAVKASGGELAPGGRLSVRFDGTGEASPGMNAPNIFSYHYVPPPGPAAALLNGGQQQQPQQYPPMAAPQPQYPPPAAPPAGSPWQPAQPQYAPTPPAQQGFLAPAPQTAPAFVGGGAQPQPAFGEQAGPPPAWAQPAPEGPPQLARPVQQPQQQGPQFTPEQVAAMRAAGVQIPGM